MGLLDLTCEKIMVQQAVEYNAQLNHPSEYKECRETRAAEYDNFDYSAIKKTFEKTHLKKNLLGRVKYIVPTPLRRILLKIRYYKHGS